MSYNGVGLSTPRGSGTSGYVVRNQSHIRERNEPYSKTAVDQEAVRRPKNADPSILEHNRKRSIEAKCYELELELEEAGVARERIEQQVQSLREQLEKDQTKYSPRQTYSPRSTRNQTKYSPRQSRPPSRFDRPKRHNYRDQPCNMQNSRRNRSRSPSRQQFKPHQTHERSEAKERENDRFKQALRLDRS